MTAKYKILFLHLPGENHRNLTRIIGYFDWILPWYFLNMKHVGVISYSEFGSAIVTSDIILSQLYVSN